MRVGGVGPVEANVVRVPLEPLQPLGRDLVEALDLELSGRILLEVSVRHPLAPQVLYRYGGVVGHGPDGGEGWGGGVVRDGGGEEAPFTAMAERRPADRGRTKVRTALDEVLNIATAKQSAVRKRG